MPDPDPAARPARDEQPVFYDPLEWDQADPDPDPDPAPVDPDEAP